MPFFDIIILAAVAGFILYRLNNVLGNTNGDELPPKMGAHLKDAKPKQQISDYYKEKAREIVEELSSDIDISDNAVLARKVTEVKQVDPSFRLKDFIKGAEYAFEMVLEAYAKGDKDTLNSLLDRDIYKQFVAAIEEREGNNEVEETTLISIASSNVMDVELVRKMARVTVKFVSKQVSVVRNEEGEIIKGDPSREITIEDVWVFERNLASSDPNWKLLSTHSVS